MYDTYIKQSDRSPMKIIVKEMTRSISSMVRDSLMEMDRPIFLMLLALEIEDLNGWFSVKH